MNLLVLRFLTLNTEDEKRDQREQKLAARGFVSFLCGLFNILTDNQLLLGVDKQSERPTKVLTQFIKSIR